MRKPVASLLVTLVVLAGFFLFVFVLSPSKSINKVKNLPYISEGNISSMNQKNESSGVDISYILVTGGKSSTLEIVDESNKKVGEGSLQQSTGIITPQVNRDLMQYMISKPASGEYYLQVNQSGSENVMVYLYDKDGEVKMIEIPSAGKRNMRYKIIYDKENIQNSSYELR